MNCIGVPVLLAGWLAGRAPSRSWALLYMVVQILAVAAFARVTWLTQARTDAGGGVALLFFPLVLTLAVLAGLRLSEAVARRL
jgi:hypothetical protein